MRTFRLQFPLLQLVRELGKREIPITPSFPFSGPLAMTTARPTWTKVSNPIVVDVPRVRLLSKSRLSLSSSPRNNPTISMSSGLTFQDNDENIFADALGKDIERCLKTSISRVTTT